MSVGLFREHGSERLFRCFVSKFIRKFFLYGYLLSIPAILSTCAFIIFAIHGYPILAVAAAAATAVSLYFLISFCSTSRMKWRYYRIGYYRLSTRPFDEEYFKYDMSAPCMRLIIKDLCHSFGYDSEYAEMKRKYSSRKVSMEMQKERLVARVLARKAKEIQEKGGMA